MKKSNRILLIISVSLVLIIVVCFAVKEQNEAHERVDAIVNELNKDLRKQDIKIDSIKKHTDSLRIINNTYRSTLSEDGKKKYDEESERIENEVDAFVKHLADSLNKADKK